MKKASLLISLILTTALSASAETERHQSFISYDDGGTIVKSGDDGRDIEAHRNLPVFPGDEIVTARRGRAEVRLSDGNILGIDRTTALRLRSILDSYEGDSNETVVELRYGKIAVHRTDLGRDHVRLDTDNASYVAENEAVYSVETDAKGSDRVMVFDGTLEIRTPTRATRLREGESATIDDNGVYDLTGDQRNAADDFERWFLKRAERFGSFDSRYVDRRLGYWTDDLDEHGRWVMVSGIGWSWRPYVSVGWRPYYHGYWHHSRGGCLTWVSYDPWGWGPYHYGRWAYDPIYGWVWVPGSGYAPAWVYWMYGSGYVGWAPSGWWDCYRPYYNWAYDRGRGWGRGFGWYGRVRTNDFDLRPWTFVDNGMLISNRVDHAALKTDIIKQRLSRAPDGYATISGGSGRMTREELRDPAETIRRRSLDGRLTGRETGAIPIDVTPFIRRDNEVAGSIRDRVVRGRDTGGSTVVSGGATGPSRTVGGVAPIGRGSVAPIGGGSVAPITGSREGTAGRVSRPNPPADATPRETTEPNRDSTPRDSGAWRDRIGGRDRTGDNPATTPSTGATTGPSTSTPSDSGSRAPRDDSWRRRIRNTEETPSGASGTSGSTGASGSTSGEVSRRIIDRVGGARVVPREDRGSSNNSGSRDRATSARDRSSGGSNSGRSSASGSSSRSSGSGSSASAPRSQPSNSGSSSSASSGRSSSSGSSSGSSSSGNRDSGGRVKRDN